jgi:hypothetical protein
MGPDHSILSVSSFLLYSRDELAAACSSSGVALAAADGSVSAAIATAAARQSEPANVESGVMGHAGQVGSGLSIVMGK